MILVSYIDILDHIGDDRKCLIEGEELFNDDKVENVHVTCRSTGDAYTISAVCIKNDVADSRCSDVSINIKKGDKKNMDSKCTCTPDRFGKCEHVVATLIYLHRHPLDNLVVSHQTKVSLRSQTQEVKKSDDDGVNKARQNKKQIEQQQQRRLRHKRRSAVLALHRTGNVLNEGRGMKVNVSKSEKEDRDEEEVDDPNWDKENDGEEEETHDEWVPSSDDDWEPISEKKRLRRGTSSQGTKESKVFSKKKSRKQQMTKAEVDQKVKELMETAEQGGNKNLTCHVCDIQLPEGIPLLQHIRDTHVLNKEINACNKCGKEFKLSKTLKAHESTCVQKRSSSGNEDDELLRLRSKRKTEVPQEPDEEMEVKAEPLQCLLCEVVTETRLAMRDHYLVVHHAHDKDSVVVCDRCGEFRLPKDHICPSQLSFRCHMCRCPFKAGRDYWNHLIRQSKKHRAGLGPGPGPGPADGAGWRCGWPGCGERFPAEDGLLQHARLHLPEHVSLMCAVCGLVLRNTDAKILHMEKHDAGVYECAACRAAFGDKSALREHWESHAVGRPHRCDTCGWRFTSAAALQVHGLKFHEGGPFCCAKCPMKFDDKTDVRIHFGAAHGKLRCPSCSFRCANKASLDRHTCRSQPSDAGDPDDPGETAAETGAASAGVGAGAEQASHICPTCGDTFKLQRELRAHLRSETHMSCKDCGKGFKSQRDLEEHRRAHTGEKPFICAECGMTFKRAQNLEYHTKGAHKNERNFVCPECSKRFISNADMKRHLRYSHQNGKKWHLCPECGHRLPSLYNLKLHVQSKHTGERPHKCSLCEAGFVASSDLKKHIMYKHHKEHPFACPQCDKRYQRRRDLQLHQQRHHGEAQHTCASCGKDFESYASMMQHARYHTTEEPFQCAKCGRRFPHRMNLSRHLCSPGIKKSYHCHTCGLNFTTSGSLKSHRRRLHAGDNTKPPPPAPPPAQPVDPPPPPPEDQAALQLLPEALQQSSYQHHSTQQMLPENQTPQHHQDEQHGLEQQQEQLTGVIQQTQHLQLHQEHHHHIQQQLQHMTEPHSPQQAELHPHHQLHQPHEQQLLQVQPMQVQPLQVQSMQVQPLQVHSPVDPSASAAYEDLPKDKLWRGLPASHDTWGLVAAPAITEESMLYHEVESANPHSLHHQHLLHHAPASTSVATSVLQPVSLLSPRSSPPAPSATLVMKTSAPPPLVSLHLKSPQVYAPAAPMTTPTLKLVSMSQPPPLTSLSSTSTSMSSTMTSSSSLILGAPIQTTADGSFHLVFVPHGTNHHPTHGAAHDADTHHSAPHDPHHGASTHSAAAHSAAHDHYSTASHNSPSTK